MIAVIDILRIPHVRDLVLQYLPAVDKIAMAQVASSERLLLASTNRTEQTEQNRSMITKDISDFFAWLLYSHLPNRCPDLIEQTKKLQCIPCKSVPWTMTFCEDQKLTELHRKYLDYIMKNFHCIIAGGFARRHQPQKRGPAYLADKPCSDIDVYLPNQFFMMPCIQVAQQTFDEYHCMIHYGIEFSKIFVIFNGHIQLTLR
jgi:hypothetical protein